MHKKRGVHLSDTHTHSLQMTRERSCKFIVLSIEKYTFVYRNSSKNGQHHHRTDTTHSINDVSISNKCIHMYIHTTIIHWHIR
jgi:hypothetical protein